MPPPWKHVDLVGDPRAGGVDQVEQRHADARGRFLDADDLFHGASAPAAGLDRRVVGHHGDLPAVDGAQPGHNSISGKVLGHDVGVEAVLHERPGVQQEVKALARRELVLLAELGQVARTTLQRPFAQLAMARVAHSVIAP